MRPLMWRDCIRHSIQIIHLYRLIAQLIVSTVSIVAILMYVSSSPLVLITTSVSIEQCYLLQVSWGRVCVCVWEYVLLSVSEFGDF